MSCNSSPLESATQSRPSLRDGGVDTVRVDNYTVYRRAADPRSGDVFVHAADRPRRRPEVFRPLTLPDGKTTRSSQLSDTDAADRRQTKPTNARVAWSADVGGGGGDRRRRFREGPASEFCCVGGMLS